MMVSWGGGAGSKKTTHDHPKCRCLFVEVRDAFRAEFKGSEAEAKFEVPTNPEGTQVDMRNAF